MSFILTGFKMSAGIVSASFPAVTEQTAQQGWTLIKPKPILCTGQADDDKR